MMKMGTQQEIEKNALNEGGLCCGSRHSLGLLPYECQSRVWTAKVALCFWSDHLTVQGDYVRVD